ncbi:MAG: HAMP domain-containing sensor histidine kinase, partial [Pseudomonadota bacterium]
IEYSHQLEEKSAQLEMATTELRAANERLKELDRLKDDFLSIVSHELRTPLTSIKSFSEILSDNPGLESAQRRDFLGIISRESERLTRLITQILDFAKMEAGRLDWNMGDVDPKTAIEDAVAAARGLVSDKPITLDIDMPNSLPAVHADRDRLIQVVVNLLSNAIRFCDDRAGRVVVSAHSDGRQVLVGVTDNGPGVAERDGDLIFEKFQQGHGPVDERSGGTGLGLSICRQIVEHFGGRIWVENVGSPGARFQFSIPLRREDALTAAAQ